MSWSAWKLSAVLMVAPLAAAESSGPGPRTVRYVLTASPSGGEVRVMLSGQLVRFRGADAQVRDVTGLLREGSNFVRLGWTNVRRPGEVSVARLGVDGQAEILFRYRLDGALKPSSGVMTVAVVREPGRSDVAHAAVKLSTFVRKGILRLTLNGQPLGDYASLERRDVSAFLRPGRNVLKIAWSKDYGPSLPSADVRLTRSGSDLLRWSGPDGWAMDGSTQVVFDVSRPSGD